MPLFSPVSAGGIGKATVTSSTGSPTIDSSTRAGKTIYKFTGSGSITIGTAGTCEVLVVGGGSGASGRYSGGGGAGGYLYETAYIIPAGTLTVTVGAGGAAEAFQDARTPKGGQSSSIGILVAAGGGAPGISGGGSITISGSYGGSGGGAGSSGGVNSGALGGNSTVGQGNTGGNNTSNFGSCAAGGGGASAAGGTCTVNGNGGTGGAGSANSITGTSVTYAGGGGGYGSATPGTGGAGSPRKGVQFPGRGQNRNRRGKDHHAVRGVRGHRRLRRPAARPRHGP